MIRIIFFDVDGTLLSHHTNTVPASTIEAFKLLKQQNILLYLCTGRHIQELEDLPLDDLAFDGMITINGQYCTYKDKLIYSNEIPKNDLKACLHFINEHHIPCYFVNEKEFFINFINNDVKIIQNAIHSPLPDVKDISHLLDEHIFQLSPVIKNESELLQHMPSCISTRWHPLAVDVLCKDGGKDNGIRHILDYHHLITDEAMAFGDGENDMSMLSYVKYGVAMGNSEQKVKDIASYITDDIDDNGLFNALKHFKVI